MPKQLGFTFLEMMIVVSIITIIAAVSMFSIKNDSVGRSLISDAELLASNFPYLITQARSSQSTIKLDCDATSIKANYFSGIRSNYVSETSLDDPLFNAKSQTDQIAPTYTRMLLTYQPKNNRAITCPADCGTLYVTSEGSLLSSLGCGTPTFLISSISTPTVAAKVMLSNLGYPRIFIKASNSSLVWTELVK